MAIREYVEDEVFREMEANEKFWKVMMGSVIEVEGRVRNYVATLQKLLGWDEERMDDFPEGIRLMVEEKRRGPRKGRTGAASKSVPGMRKRRDEWPLRKAKGE